MPAGPSRWRAISSRSPRSTTYPERLVAACREEGRAEFLFTALPLRLAGAAGSPANPVAVF